MECEGINNHLQHNVQSITSRSYCSTSRHRHVRLLPGPTLTGMVRIRPDMVSMWSRFVVANTVHWQEEPSTVRGHMGSGLWLATVRSRKGALLIQC